MSLGVNMVNPRELCSETCTRYREELKHPCIRGVGPEDSKIMFIGETPGRTEDEKGEPFVGRSGELLDTVFEELNIKRESVYITNAVKCFTYREDPKPTDKELRCCKSYLVEEIKKVRPNVICALGASALKATLNRTGIKKLKNNVFISDLFSSEGDALNIKVVPTFHPAWVLRNPGDYDLLKAGVKLAMSEASEENIVFKPKITGQYLVADTLDKIDKVLSKLETLDHFVFDLETTSLNYIIAKIICVAFSWKIGFGVVVPWNLLNETQLSRLRSLFTSNKTKIGHNIKYDIQVLIGNKISIKGPFFDTMLAHALINENMRQGLDSLVLHYTDMGEYWSALEEAKSAVAKERKIGKEDVSYDMLPMDVLYPYACKDADATYRFYQFKDELEKLQLLDFYNNHMIPLMPILLKMEYRGITIDRQKLKILIDDYSKKLSDMGVVLHTDSEVIKYENRIKTLEANKLEEKYNSSKTIKTRYPNGADQYINDRLKPEDYLFNFKSPKQLSELLFDQMKLEPVKKTPTGGNSTDEETLLVYCEQNVSIAQKIIDYRKLSKYISTYLESTYEKSESDGRIHTSYLQAHTSTGRLASERPNLQNLPRDALDFKECFVADPGYVFLKSDLAQAEFRCWAHYSKDPDMINDIESGMDIHRRIASKVFGVPEEEIKKGDPRRSASKAVVFGLMFGRGAKAIAMEFGISIMQAEKIKNLFFNMYPVATDWLKEQIVFAKKNGYVKTWFGRIRRLPEIYSEDKQAKAEAERQALNSPIQGQASDMNNAYLVSYVKRAKEEGIDCYPALTIHDDNTFQVREDQVDKLIVIMKDVVKTSFPDFRVSMKLDFAVGKTLGTVKGVD